MDDVKYAEDFARMAHKGQKDKGGHDYINHPIAVAKMVNTDVDKIVALLHDVLEDTDVKEVAIRWHFGNEVADAVLALTRRENEDYFDFIQRAKNNPIAKRVKIADITHNMDFSRLNEITNEDRARLKKYYKALDILQGKE